MAHGLPAVGDEEGVPGSDTGLTVGCESGGKIDRSADAPGSRSQARIVGFTGD